MADDLVDALLTSSRALVAVAARSMAAIEDEVTVTQFRALVVLYQSSSVSLSALADELDVKPSTATRLCDRLVAKGLITRTDAPNDRRQLELRLTDSGRSVVATVYERRRRDLQAIVRRIPADDRPAVLEAFRIFAGAAPRSDGETLWGWPR